MICKHSLISYDLAAVENPPDHDQDKLLLDEDFTDEMMEMYSPVRQKQNPNVKLAVPNSSRTFPVKFLNIMDPLLPTNNLGRSVNKASFARIRKALAHGAKTLSNIMTKVRSFALWYAHVQRMQNVCQLDIINICTVYMIQTACHSSQPDMIDSLIAA